MPDPKTCAAKGLRVGTKEYEDCIKYRGHYAKKGGSSTKSAGGRAKPPTGGGY